MSAAEDTDVHVFAGFSLDHRRRLLFGPDGQAVHLSPRAFDTLLYLVEHPNQLIDKRTLMKAVWPNAVVEENNLNQHIAAVRRALGETPGEHRFVVTVQGRGFQFVPPVTAAVAPVSSVVQPRTKGNRWVFGAAGLVLIAGFTWYVTHLPAREASPAVRASSTPSADVAPVREPRLAVLPFENLSPDPMNGFFADGLNEEIVSTIAEHVPGIEVISRTTMMRYRADAPRSLAVVARELGASHLMEGSVRREADTIRLTLRLIDARTSNDIWSTSYDSKVADAPGLESQVADAVARQLSAKLIRSPRPAAAPIRDTEAFDLYLKALLALRKFNATPADFLEIEDLLTRVIARQPTFALAYAQRARARTIMFISSHDTSEAFVRQIRSDLDTALRLAPDDPIVLAANGYFLMCENDTTGALHAYEAAESAGLGEPEWLIPKAQLLLRRSRIEELNATVQRMLELDPADPLVISFAAFHFDRAQQPLDALRAAEYARAAYPRLYEDWRARISLDFAGRTEELRSFLARYKPADDPARLGDSLVEYFALLRFEHRYAELRAQIDRVPDASHIYYAGVDYGPIGQTPTALYRGWTDMLLGDRASASKDGRVVLQFVERQVRTLWNGAYLETLAAAGQAFVGECERAKAAGRRALALVSRADNAVVWVSTAANVARADAWCDGQDESVALLQQLSTGRPGIGPGAITRDPLYTVPLGKLSAYRALADSLESKIRSTRLEARPRDSSVL